jgi:hypothetical protein
MLLTVAVVVCPPLVASAQDQAEIVPPAAESAPADLAPAPNGTAGEFTPAKGFDLIKSDWGSLNFSGYGLFRYVDQTPGEQTFVDHLGRTREVKARNDLNWHRTMLWFSGFALTPRLKYVFTVWSLPTTQQTLAFGNLQFEVVPAMILGAGIGPNLTNRSMQGSHPFWAASDRQMGEEFFRGGFSSGFWIRGEPLPRFFYTVSVNTNLSQLGITANNDSRDLAYSASLWWMPTTGEFGLRGGLADFEEHERLATRFGLSGAHAREDRAAAVGLPPNATQIRLSDGVLAFEEGALAEGITVQRLNYDILSFDAGFKWRGISLQAEYYLRWLSHFDATGPLPLASIFDHGFFVEAMYMVLPRLLGLYATGSAVRDEFRRFPWEVAGGASYFPLETRSWRLNAHVIYVDKSPTGSSFGYYTAGQTGVTLSLGTDVLF